MPALAERVSVSKPSSSVLFASRREDLRLVRMARYPIMGAAGQKVGEHKGQALQFRGGIARVEEAGIELEDGSMLPMEEALAWLRGHRMLGNQEEGFMEVFQAAPVVSEAELDALLQATWDEDALVLLIGQEEAGWAREALLRPAQGALERLREAKAEIAAETKAAPKAAAKG